MLWWSLKCQSSCFTLSFSVHERVCGFAQMRVGVRGCARVRAQCVRECARVVRECARVVRECSRVVRECARGVRGCAYCLGARLVRGCARCA